MEDVKSYESENEPIVIGINAVNSAYDYDYLFFSNTVRYDYAKEIYPEIFQKTKKIVTSNVKPRRTIRNISSISTFSSNAGGSTLTTPALCA